MSTFHEQVLLIGRNPAVPLGPFDGRVAAIIKDFVCTTPNQDRIPLPAMQKREVYMRADYRYGPDDPTLWPQPWLTQYPHLGAIPKKPNDPKDILSIMWWDPTREDFKSFDNSLVDGLGELSRTKFLSFSAMMEVLENRIDDYKRTSPKPNTYLLSIVKATQDACVRLGSLKTTFTEMRFGVTEFQRHYLEVCGLLDYLEFYKPRMDGQKPAADTVANCVGIYTNIARIAQDFHTAGLPVWLLRPKKVWESPLNCNIVEIVAPVNPADVLCVSQHDPPFPPIFCGLATEHGRHSAIIGYSRMWLVFKDPFQGESKAPKASTIQSVSVNRDKGSRSSAQSVSSSISQTIQPGQRDKFSPLDGPFAPFLIPAWSAGLRAVDQSPTQLIESSKSLPHYGHYVFPDPGLFTSPATDEKKAQYIGSWLRARDAWFMRLTKESSLAMSNQHWRTFLSAEPDVLAKEGTKAARRRQEVLAMIIPKSDTYPEVKMRIASNGPLAWQGKEYPPGMLPSKDVVRQVLWELYEVNFIHELLSLDRRACEGLDLSDTAQLFERELKISQCFPLGSFRHVTIPSENCGFAADNFNQRLPFIIALFLVVKSWKGDKPDILTLSEDYVRHFSLRDAMKLEQVIAKYYCQQFFKYFGRAAQIPHRLFATKDV